MYSQIKDLPSLYTSVNVYTEFWRVNPFVYIRYTQEEEEDVRHSKEVASDMMMQVPVSVSIRKGIERVLHST